ncbi:MAG: SUMF1/EgtB/PvdO family nonheme iron enzyme [Bacteroidota bacterium]
MLHNLPPLTLATLESHMVYIQGGTFMMGGEHMDGDSFPEHNVNLDNFLCCRFPVTQKLYQEVSDSSPSQFTHSQKPVERVHWYDAIMYCNALSRKYSLQEAYLIDFENMDPNNENGVDNLKYTVSFVPSANGYRLPTEAEWEYAARGGQYAQTFPLAGSPNDHEVAWSDITSHDMSQPIGLRTPNSLGLFDMSGNVSEWVWDWRDHRDGEYFQQCEERGTVQNPVGPISGKYRGVRGGSWFNYDDNNNLRIAW